MPEWYERLKNALKAHAAPPPPSVAHQQALEQAQASIQPSASISIPEPHAMQTLREKNVPGSKKEQFAKEHPRIKAAVAALVKNHPDPGIEGGVTPEQNAWAMQQGDRVGRVVDKIPTGTKAPTAGMRAFNAAWSLPVAGASTVVQQIQLDNKRRDAEKIKYMEWVKEHPAEDADDPNYNK